MRLDLRLGLGFGVPLVAVLVCEMHGLRLCGWRRLRRRRWHGRWHSRRLPHERRSWSFNIQQFDFSIVDVVVLLLVVSASVSACCPPLRRVVVLSHYVDVHVTIAHSLIRVSIHAMGAMSIFIHEF